MSDYFPDMHRIKTEHGDYIDPPLNQDWSTLMQLEWQLAVLRVDTGIIMTVQYGRTWIGGVELPDQFCYSAKNQGWSSRGFNESWDFINGISTGATLAREQRKNPIWARVPLADDYDRQWEEHIATNQQQAPVDEPARWTQPESIVCMDYPNCPREHAGGAGGVPVHPPTGSRISGDEPIPGYPARWTQPNFAPGISSVIRDNAEAESWARVMWDEVTMLTDTLRYQVQKTAVLSDEPLGAPPGPNVGPRVPGHRPVG